MKCYKELTRKRAVYEKTSQTANHKDNKQSKVRNPNLVLVFPPVFHSTATWSIAPGRCSRLPILSRLHKKRGMQILPSDENKQTKLSLRFFYILVFFFFLKERATENPNSTTLSTDLSVRGRWTKDWTLC